LLDCLGRFGSIREIAAAQHMHHSSVAYRLAKISEILGYDPRTPQRQYRARTALLLWHLHTHLPARSMMAMMSDSDTVRISPAPAPRQTSPAARIRPATVGCASASAR
jgi:hypothetical protein